jgi:NAD(P)-dependent dehydrogenase (short-subunit alcohol dehydrogenase family)
MDRFIVTGGNRGLGFALARHLAATDDSEVVLAVRDPKRGRRAAREIGSNVEVMELDLADATSVDRFADGIDQPIAGLINNAGVQHNDRTCMTDDGIEETFAVNHLNALKLTMRLSERLRGGRVMFIGSGTHNPRHPTATRFGFRGEQFRSIDDCAAGLDSSEDIGQLGKDRYATTKFLNMTTTVELARRFGADELLVVCLDPGLMPGTDLVRSAPAFLRFGWHYVLPVVAKVLPDASTPDRSGAAGAWLMTAPAGEVQHGGIYSYDRQLSDRVIDRIRDPEVGRVVVDESLRLLETAMPGGRA